MAKWVLVLDLLNQQPVSVISHPSDLTFWQAYLLLTVLRILLIIYLIPFVGTCTYDDCSDSQMRSLKTVAACSVACKPSTSLQ